MSGYNDSGGARNSRPAGLAGGPGPERRSPPGLAGRITAGCLAFALVGGSLFVYVKYRQIWASIQKVDVSRDVTGPRPFEDPKR